MIKRHVRKFGLTWRNQSGQAMVELALSLPILLVILVGVAEFGRFAYFAIEVANAAHAGVQYGAQTNVKASDNTGMKTAATSDGSNVPGISASASHSCACTNGAASTCLPTDCTGARIIEYVQVNTTATVSPIFNYPGISRTLTLNGQATMRVEQ